MYEVFFFSFMKTLESFIQSPEQDLNYVHTQVYVNSFENCLQSSQPQMAHPIPKTTLSLKLN